MNTMKKLLSVLLVLAMVLSMAACDGGTTPQETTAPTTGNENTEKAAYEVSLQTKGGMVMSGIDVYVYADSSLSDLKDYGQTDENGKVSFQLPQGGEYVVALSGVPEGYQVEPYYAFTGNTAAISLSSALISDGNLAGASLGLGDVMYDFTVTTPAGEKVTLSEVLKEKDVAMLNFWYVNCSNCVAEFPYIEEAYQMYKDDVAVIALNPFDDDAAITSFQSSMNLNFTMASCQPAWANAFGITGYPTTVFVDRYGVICLIEIGGMPSLRPFTCAFDHFIGDDYEQKLCENINAVISQVKPTFTMDSSETIGAAINSGEITVTYRPETEDDNAEYIWPFILTEKNGEQCLKASNQQIEDSYAILYADVELKAGQALGFDYIVSSEVANDVAYVIVNDEDIYQISGVYETEQWKSCYPCVALEDGTYELAICYGKDESTNAGDDTIYIKNMRVVDASAIDAPTYIPREAATTVDGFDYTYVDVVLNEKDGYYHVGDANGPLLLADLMGYTALSEEKPVYFMCYDGDVKVNGESYYDTMLKFFTLASNSSLNGVCTVNAELAECLKVVASQMGFDGTENEWLKVCKYFEAYGTSGEQLVDPIKGLATYSAYEAKLGKNVESNYFYYDRPILPRGLFAKFVPTKSGVYRVTSRSDSVNGVEGWIFDENMEKVYTYEHSERMYEDSKNVSMVYYMEAGKAYYIDIAFWDVYDAGTIPYDVEYLGASYKLFRTASPGYFTYDTNATGDAMYYTISGGIDVILGDDGIYYEDLGVDANGKQRYGSKLYADFTGITSIFNRPISTVTTTDSTGKEITVKGMIDMGGFDFSKSENDLQILGYMAQNNNDIAATDEYLKALWGADYETYAQEYKIEDVFAGRYHGKGEDMTEQVRAYLDQIITTGSEECRGCVVVTEELAQILQLLMEKYTFENVEQSWPKLCYYYQQLG